MERQEARNAAGDGLRVWVQVQVGNSTALSTQGQDSADAGCNVQVAWPSAGLPEAQASSALGAWLRS